MRDKETARLVLDIVSSLLGIVAGVLLLASGTVGLPSPSGIAVPVTVLGVLGAAFSLVGIAHVYVDAHRKGAGEFAAGVGAMLVGLSFGVQPQTPPFAIGVVVLLVGALLIVADSFDLNLPTR